MPETQGDGTLTIANGATESDEFDVPGRTEQLVIETPAALSGTVTLQGSLDGSTFKDLHSDGAAITLPADAIHIIYPIAGVRKVKLVSGASETAERAFPVRAEEL